MTIRTHTTRQGKVIHLLSHEDLRDAVMGGTRLRIACPIHGGDHQRSLSIDPVSLWGYCHCCHATVRLQQPEQLGNGNIQSNKPFANVTTPEGNASFVSREHSYRHGIAHAMVDVQPPSWQQEERSALAQLVPLLDRSLLASQRARIYLEQRRISLSLARSCALGYLSRASWQQAKGWLSHRQSSLLTRWIGRLIFPLHSPDGCGFIGRTLVGWEPGMDEQTHKTILEQREMPQRWIKTNPAGWFGFAEPAHLRKTLILVEGGFDRLALLAAGIPASSVVALVGTAATSQWLITHAPQVKRVVLALDADEGGITAMERLSKTFKQVGVVPLRCPPPTDSWGKDWSERYRRLGPRCIAPLYETVLPHEFTPYHL